ncbi:MAG: formylmethanofuran dehydrogenase subunit E family protein [Epsilonproteobacteria bacterium]|nr:formylmethanofuran dehydrogenase subunit E family protein [Campylobacterota bacterium]
MQNYPTFFQNIPTITLKDPLSNFLGTFENGVVEFSYLDIVKSAGHSCPTVAGAYLMTLKGLKALYSDDSIPIRGNIYVSLKGDALEGVTGVIANVITQITGATEHSGFKGLNGKFARNNLMKFNADISSALEFKRLDTGKTVQVSYDPSSISANPKMQELMGKLMQGLANPEEKKEFGELWQERVKGILENMDKVVTIKS